MQENREIWGEYEEMCFLSNLWGEQKNKTLVNIVGFQSPLSPLSTVADRYQWLLNFAMQWVLNKTSERASHPLPPVTESNSSDSFSLVHNGFSVS